MPVGSLTPRSGDSWYLQVCINGNRFNTTIHASSRTKAEKELSKFYTECEKGTIRNGNIQFDKLCDEYIKNYAEVNLKRSTASEMKQFIDTKLKHDFKGKASKIKRKDVQLWINKLSETLSPKTVRNYYGNLSAIMKWGVKMEYITSTPCEFIDLPKKVNKESSHYELDDIKKLVSVLPKAELSYQIAISLMLLDGLRISEVTGMNWSDIDMTTGEYKIERQRLYRAKIGSYEDDPKSNTSKRFGAVPKDILKLMQKMKVQQAKDKLQSGTKWIDTDAVFKDWNGRPKRSNQIYNYWKKFCRDNELKYINPHGLRHTYASMLLYMDLDIKEIQTMMGHSQPSTTENIYIHLIEDHEKKSKEISNKVQNLIKDIK